MNEIWDYLERYGEVTITTDGCYEVDVNSITFGELRSIHLKMEALGFILPKIEIYSAIHDRLVTIKINL